MTAIARKAGVIAGATALFAFVGVQGAAAIAVRGAAPEALAQFSPGTFPAAGTRLAEMQLDRKNFDQAVTLARPAVLADPMNVRAVRTLGLALDGVDARSKDRAARVMRTATALSWRDTSTSLWALRDAAQRADIPEVLNQIDALARRQVHPELTGRLFYAGITDVLSRRAFAGLLARNPPWRAGFFNDIRVNLPPTSYVNMEALYDEMDRTAAPPSAQERLNFIARMTDSGHAQRARAFWLRSFDIAAGAGAQRLYDSNFRLVAQRPSSAPVSPFEWSIGPDATSYLTLRQTDNGAEVQIAPGAAHRTGLMEQTLVLTPGQHRIDAKVDGPEAQASAEWQIYCMPTNTPLIRRFDRQGNALSGITITIPANSCTSQRLVLTANDRMGARPVTITGVTIR